LRFLSPESGSGFEVERVADPPPGERPTYYILWSGGVLAGNNWALLVELVTKANEYRLFCSFRE